MRFIVGGSGARNQIEISDFDLTSETVGWFLGNKVYLEP